ncbi:MAG: hypothetical protein WBO48_13775 [Candidatus Promineifilaceae bacterium]
MTFILIFTASSFIASIFTISACMLSARHSHQESLAKVYVE